MNSREIARKDYSSTVEKLKAMSERCDEVKAKLEESIKFFEDHPEIAEGADLFKQAHDMFNDLPF